MTEIADTLRLVAPEFSQFSLTELERWIELTAPLVSEKKFGKLYNQAVAYLTAHRMKMGGLGDTSSFGTIGESMRLSSVSEGGVSVSFSAPSASLLDTDAELALTPYGLAFLSLRRKKIMSIVTSGGAMR